MALPMAGDAEPVTVIADEGFHFSGSLSPDGKWFASTQLSTESSMVFATSFPEPGRRWQICKDAGGDGIWSADGKQILYVRPDGQIVAVNVSTDGSGLRIGAEEPLFARRDALGGTATADQQKFLLLVRPKGRQVAPLILVQNWLQEVNR